MEQLNTNEQEQQQKKKQTKEAPMGLLLSLALSEFILKMTLLTERNPLGRKAIRQLGRELLVVPFAARLV